MSGECQICHEHCLDCQCGKQRLGCHPPGPLHDMRITLHPPEMIPIPEYKEVVNHPDHYQGNSIEVIDVIEDFQLGFNLGNAIKYILRAGKKGNKLQDLKKAIWYLEREILNEQEQLSSQNN